MKINSTKTKIRSTVKKVLKNTQAKKSETFSISVNTRPSLPKYNGSCNIRDIAKTLKSRLSNVAKRFALDDNKSVSVATAPMVTASQQTAPLQIDTTPTTPLSLDTFMMESLSPLSIESAPESPAIQTPPPMLLDEAFSPKGDELNSLLNQVSAAFPTNSNVCCNSPFDSQPISPAMLATADWSSNTIDMESGKKAKMPSLYNLHTLKQYLTFISQETEEVSLENGAINLTVSNDHEMISSTTQVQQASRLGATLIELSVHDPSMKIEHFKDESYSKHPNMASRINRRRPGRPPKSIKSFSVDKSTMKTKRDSIVQRHQQRQQQKHKKDSIDCICNLAHEEFGTMVQCDDCLSWLHLDCLELDEKALEETFRCPSCFIKFGNGNETEAKLLSTVTWRYAAKYQSEVLATNSSKDDDEEDDDYMDLDESEVSLYSYSESVNQPLNPAASVAAAVVAIPPMFDIQSYTTPVEESYNDWCDGLSSQDGYSEAGTPSDTQACSDDYWFAPPSAANVFLWENNLKTSDVAFVISSIPSLPDIEPSAVCAQELPTFNNYFLEASF